MPSMYRIENPTKLDRQIHDGSRAQRRIFIPAGASKVAELTDDVFKHYSANGSKLKVTKLDCVTEPAALAAATVATPAPRKRAEQASIGSS